MTFNYMLQRDNGSEDIGYAFLARRVSQAAHASSPNNGGRGLHLGGPWWKYSVKNRGCHDKGELVSSGLDFHISHPHMGWI